MRVSQTIADHVPLASTADSAHMCGIFYAQDHPEYEERKDAQAPIGRNRGKARALAVQYRRAHELRPYPQNARRQASAELLIRSEHPYCRRFFDGWQTQANDDAIVGCEEMLLSYRGPVIAGFSLCHRRGKGFLLVLIRFKSMTSGRFASTLLRPRQ